ncbi:MAG: 3-deoxy-D-manno-octulosonic acid transferase [Candidatus Firestonebacteria bacterium]|nr:3-deoxy-D-manno-octulosonic acid transferase [Candidatus Firestonebacteria bacterium]
MKKNVFFVLYNILGCIFLIAGFPFFLFFKKSRKGFFVRLSFYPQNWRKSLKNANVVWIHVASLGEINAIQNFIIELQKNYSQYKILISTITDAGYTKACKKFGDSAFVIYAPLDISFIVNRTLNFFNPKIILIAETELWPNMITEAKKKNINLCIINGRITDKSIKYYLQFNKFFDIVLNCIDKYCVQNEKEKNNFLKLGIEKNKIAICGQTKFDVEIDIPFSERQKIRQNLGLSKEDFLWVAGSTRPGEEEIIIEVFLEIKKIVSCKLIIAPRHINRTGEIIKIIDKKGINCKKLSAISYQPSAISQEPSIFILDLLGQLLSYYAIANVSFVGGTLQNYGGHNLIEPALLACPVIFGTYTSNVSDIAHILIESGGGKCVKNGFDIKQILIEYIANPIKAKTDGEKAYKAVNEKKGASKRTLNEIRSFM